MRYYQRLSNAGITSAPLTTFLSNTSNTIVTYNAFINTEYSLYIENNVCTRVTNCFSAHERAILCLIPELRSNEGNKHKNDTRVSAETVCDESTYIILFLTRQNVSINDDKNDDFHASAPCLTCSVFVLLMTSQSIADDVTITWIMKFNSLAFDFIHGDIHGRSCKKC